MRDSHAKCVSLGGSEPPEIHITHVLDIEYSIQHLLNIELKQFVELRMILINIQK